jgi:4-hydroxybenzoate polyprenyltransferase
MRTLIVGLLCLTYAPLLLLAGGHPATWPFFWAYVTVTCVLMVRYFILSSIKPGDMSVNARWRVAVTSVVFIVACR